MKKRKFLAVLLACACVFTIGVGSACAEEEPKTPPSTESVESDPAMDDIYDGG